MELRQYLDFFRRWLWLILLGVVLASSTAFVVTRLTTPIYRATTTLVISQSTGATPVTDYTSLLTSQQLAKTYAELLKKRPTLQTVIQNLNLDKTPAELLKQMEVSLIRDTTLIAVSVEDENPSRAQAIADEIARVFVGQVRETQHARFSSSEESLVKQLHQLQSDLSSTQRSLDLARAAVPPNPAEIARLESAVLQYQTSYSNLLKSYEDMRTAEARLMDNVYVAEPAAMPDRPVRPQTLLNTLLGTVVGAMLAVGVAFLIEYLDDTVKTPDDLAALDLVNMGMVGRINLPDPTDKLIVVREPRSPVAEAFRAFRTNIQFSSVDRPLRVLLVTSPGLSEGKSTVATNLAAALAQAGQSVALVDADLRRPSVHRIMQITNNLGLTNALLQDEGPWDGVLRPTPVENLKVITSGPLPLNPAELLGSERIGRLIDELKKRVDVVILDSPPCLVVTDAAVLSKRADGVLLVLETGATRRESARQAAQSLRQVGANVVGTVLNKLPARGRSGYYNYQYYYYYSAQSGERVEKGRRHAAKGLSFLWKGNGSQPAPAASEPGVHPTNDPQDANLR